MVRVMVRVRVSVRVRARGMVPGGTGPIGFAKHRSWGVLNYDAVHLARGPLTHYTIPILPQFFFSSFPLVSDAAIGSALLGTTPV